MTDQHIPHSHSSDPADRPQRRTAEKVRQGERGRPVLAILVVSVALVVGGFALLAWLQSAGAPASIGGIDDAPSAAQVDDRPAQ